MAAISLVIGMVLVLLGALLTVSGFLAIIGFPAMVLGVLILAGGFSAPSSSAAVR
jgi:hypothetical protein